MLILPELPEQVNIHPDGGAVRAIIIENPGDLKSAGTNRGRQHQPFPFFHPKGLRKRLGHQHLTGSSGPGHRFL